MAATACGVSGLSSINFLKWAKTSDTIKIHSYASRSKEKRRKEVKMVEIFKKQTFVLHIEYLHRYFM